MRLLGATVTVFLLVAMWAEIILALVRSMAPGAGDVNGPFMNAMVLLAFAYLTLATARRESRP